MFGDAENLFQVRRHRGWSGLCLRRECLRFRRECLSVPISETRFGPGQKPIKLGMGKSVEIDFTIEKWIARPAPLVEALAKLAAGFGKPPNGKDESADGSDDFEDEELPANDPLDDGDDLADLFGKPKPAA